MTFLQFVVTFLNRLNFLIESVTNFTYDLTLSLTDFNKNAIPFLFYYFKTRLFIMFLMGPKKLSNLI